MAKKLEHDNGTVRDATDSGVSICTGCSKPHHPSLDCPRCKDGGPDK